MSENQAPFSGNDELGAYYKQQGIERMEQDGLMERGRMLIIIGILLGLLTVIVLVTTATATIQETGPPIDYRVIEFSGDKYDCWIIESNTDHYATITGGCFKK